MERKPMNGGRHFFFVILVALMTFVVNLGMNDIGGNNTVIGSEVITRSIGNEDINNYAGLTDSDQGGVNPVTGVFFVDPINYFLKALRTIGFVLGIFVFPFASLLSSTSIPTTLQLGINAAWALYSIISIYAFVSNKT